MLKQHFDELIETGGGPHSAFTSDRDRWPKDMLPGVVFELVALFPTATVRRENPPEQGR